MKSFRTFTNCAALALSVGNSAGVFENTVIGLKFTKAGKEELKLAENPCKNARENKLVGKKPPVFHSAFFQDYQDPINFETIKSQDDDYVCGKTTPYFRRDLKRICRKGSKPGFYQMVENIHHRFTMEATDCVDPLTRENYDTEELFWLYYGGIQRFQKPDGRRETITKSIDEAGRLQEVQEFPDSGEKISQQYRNGVKDGVREVTFADGQRETSEWKEGKIQNGRYSETTRDGRRISGEWKNGEKHGQEKCVFRNGSVSETEWKNGKLHGVEIHKDEKGVIVCRAHWKDGRKHGPEVALYGITLYETRWENGTSLEEKIFSDSQVISQKLRSI